MEGERQALRFDLRVARTAYKAFGLTCVGKPRRFSILALPEKLAQAGGCTFLKKEAALAKLQLLTVVCPQFCPSLYFVRRTAATKFIMFYLHNPPGSYRMGGVNKKSDPDHQQSACWGCC